LIFLILFQSLQKSVGITLLKIGKVCGYSIDNINI